MTEQPSRDLTSADLNGVYVPTKKALYKKRKDWAYTSKLDPGYVEVDDFRPLLWMPWDLNGNGWPEYDRQQLIHVLFEQGKCSVSKAVILCQQLTRRTKELLPLDQRGKVGKGLAYSTIASWRKKYARQ